MHLQNPEWRTRLKKDPGIPNLFPYKEKLLAEIEEKKRLKEEDTVRRKAEVKAQRAGVAVEDEEQDDEDAMEEDGFDEDEEIAAGETSRGDANPMAALLASAKARAVEYEEDGEDDEMDEDGEDEWDGINEDDDDNQAVGPKKDSSRKAFDKIFKEVVDAADVVLYVLDARDAEGTRSREVERAIMSAEGGDKRLILVLNKIDLVPPPVLKGWLTHLRRYFPTLPLRASGPAPNARTFDHKQLTVKATSESLFRALKSFAQAKQLKRSISVGVIGYPNVGKSSVINALTHRLGGRTGVCPTGAEAGVTTSMRSVKLDGKLKLLDSPGIVFPSTSGNASKAETQARLILLNAVPPKEIEDPMPAVDLLLKRLSGSPGMLEKLYGVYELPALMSTNGDTLTDFLVQVARKRGRLGKGGVPNIHSAAQTVLTDWRDGRIQGWMDPPILEATQDGKIAEAAPEGDHKIIVKEWAAEFKLDGLLWENDEAEAGAPADKMES
jgi:nuclear GTP-binding protein